jgi:hypothetical protein
MLGAIDLTWLTIIEEKGLRPGAWLNSLTGYIDGPDEFFDTKLDWIIAGGESGPQARPMHPKWVRSIRDQCKAAGVPFLFKQHGEWLTSEFCDGDTARIPFKRLAYVRQDGSFHDGSEGIDFFGSDEETAWVGKKRAGRLLDGVLHNEYPGEK